MTKNKKDHNYSGQAWNFNVVVLVARVFVLTHTGALVSQQVNRE